MKGEKQKQGIEKKGEIPRQRKNKGQKKRREKTRERKQEIENNGEKINKSQV